MPAPAGFSLMLFLAVLVFCVGAFVAGVAATARPERRLRDGGLALAGAVLWVALTSVPTGLGWVTPERAVPGVPLVMGSLLLVAVVLSLSPLGRRLGGLPLCALVGFQAMRLPLEVVLHLWGDEGVVPVQMTWSGQNPDVLSGIVCLLLAPFVGRSRLLAWVSQVVGVVLLINVLRVVATSLPTPLQQFDEPLLLPFMLPSFWIAPVCVFGALLFHGITLRRLLAEGAQASGAGSHPQAHGAGADQQPPRSDGP